MAGLSASNLSDVRQLVKDWADRSDISDSVIDNFINIAGQRANRELEISPLESSATLTFTDNTLPIPSDYARAKQLKVEVGGRVVTLERKPIFEVEELSAASYSGIPCFFSEKEGVFIVAPSPNGIEEATLNYYIEVDTLVNDTDTNWLVTDGTTALLYGALKELNVYVSDEETAATYQGQFVSAVDEIQTYYDESESSGSTLSVNNSTTYTKYG